jgi:hypothetical protein
MSNHLIPSIDAPVTTGQSVLTALAELVARHLDGCSTENLSGPARRARRGSWYGSAVKRWARPRARLATGGIDRGSGVSASPGIDGPR